MSIDRRVYYEYKERTILKLIIMIDKFDR